MNATIEGVAVDTSSDKDECMAELLYLKSMIDHTLLHRQADRALKQFQKDIWSNVDHQKNPIIVKYYIRILSMFDTKQVGIDQKVAWERLKQAQELYTKVLKPLEMTKELSRLEIV